MLQACVGRRELGKTTLAYHASLSRPKRVIFDPRCTWQPTHGRIVYGGLTGIPLEEFPDALAVAWTEAPEIVIQPNPHDEAPDADRDHWVWFTRQLRTHLVRHPHDTWAVIVDEFGEVDRWWPHAAWRFTIKSVPRKDVDLYVTAHQPMNVHSYMRSIVDTWFVFRTVDPDDLKVLKRRSVPADVLAELPTLPPYVYFEWDESTARGRYVNDPARWKETLTPPYISRDRQQLFTLRRIS